MLWFCFCYCCRCFVIFCFFSSHFPLLVFFCPFCISCDEIRSRELSVIVPYGCVPAFRSVACFMIMQGHSFPSLVPRPRPSTRERGSGNFSRFSWHFVRFKSCDTCLCACAFQQQARDPRTAHCVVPRGWSLFPDRLGSGTETTHFLASFPGSPSSARTTY